MRKSYQVYFVVIIAGIFLSFPVMAEVSISSYPAWQAEYGNYPTGIAWVDINNDGWLDIVSGVGIDVIRRPNVAYYNYRGQLQSSPGWVSGDVEASCNVYTGDLDADGDQDLVICSLGNLYEGYPLESQVIYYNDDGFSQWPDWSSPLTNAFSCAMGDPDCDGDLDIVFAEGNNSAPYWGKSRIFFNEDGVFDTIAGWEVDNADFMNDVAFGDINNDGYIDLVLSGQDTGIWAFYNHEGTLETTPSWVTHETIGARQLEFGDIDNDGDLDLALAECGNSVNGFGYFLIFYNHNGVLETSPSWRSTRFSQPSCLALCDVDGDGDLDLAGGGWYCPAGIFENIDGALTENFVWSYSGGGWLQQLAWGDYDNDYLIDTVKTITAWDNRGLYYLDKRPVQKIDNVAHNGRPLLRSQYCYDLTEGWISIGETIEPGDEIVIQYTFSRDYDLAVTGSRINVFENLTHTGIPGDNDDRLPGATQLSQCYPNPFNNSTTIIYYLNQPSWISIDIYNISGQKLITLLDRYQAAGEYHITWNTDNFSSGIYLYKLETSTDSEIKKMVLLK
jgi:hypothetical protein